MHYQLAWNSGMSGLEGKQIPDYQSKIMVVGSLGETLKLLSNYEDIAKIYLRVKFIWKKL